MRVANLIGVDEKEAYCGRVVMVAYRSHKPKEWFDSNAAQQMEVWVSGLNQHIANVPNRNVPKVRFLLLPQQGTS